jgi:OHCU decarboxylase
VTDLERLNRMPDEELERELLSCCGSRAWARAVAGRGPFPGGEALLTAADEVWDEMGPDAWREAFDAHPRIGETKAAAGQTEREARWSRGEQAGVEDADGDVRERLAAANRAYEERFGHIFLVCAAGKSAEEMLGLLRERMRNDPETELRVAAGEQRKITRLRLEKLLADHHSSEVR